jgi:cation diffusion facilitator family transporter
MAEHGSSARAILYAFLANLGIALSKLGAAIYTNSGSMLAESIHSFADCGNQVLLYLGIKQSQRPPTPQHPLGFGKMSYFWSFIVALMLFSVGGLFSIQEGWHKLHAPEPIKQAWVALLVLGVSIVLETFSTMGCLREINKLRKGRSLRQWVETTRNAELVVVLGEDLAALVGLILAFVFVSMAAVTGNALYDAFGSIVIGVVLIIVAIFIAVRIKGLIVGRSAEEDLQNAISEHIRATDGIEDLLNAITFQLGPQVMLAIKVRMTPGISIEKAIDQLNGLERSIKAKFPEVAWCFVEPDNAD